LLARARRSRGCVTPGDDRLETRAYAVKRYLFRLGHAARSARYATSIEQLVVGLAPVMAWGTVPRGRAERARFVRAHRKSVQRWLDDLEAAGLVAHEPERDDLGRWWRTQIVLLAASEPDCGELEVAEVRARAWSRRERGRRGRPGRRSLTGIRRRSATPDQRSRARLARGRGVGGHERGRRAAVERAIAASEAVRKQRGLLTHPFGAPPTSAHGSVSQERSWQPETPRSWARTADRSAPTPRGSWALVAETGARTSARSLSPVPPQAARTDGTEESVPGREPHVAFDALVARRLVERRDQVRQRTALQRTHAERRIAQVLAWPAGRRCPLGRLREAWVVYRYGLEWVAQGGAAMAGAHSASTARRAYQAIALYERFVAWRPAGWPQSGPAALLALAGQRRADVFAGDVARLLILAKQMRAAAREQNEHRRRRQAARAERRAAPAPGRFAFRASIAPRWESPEQRRQRVRDRVLMAGEDPARWPNAALVPEWRGGRVDGGPALTGPDPCDALDGIGARAACYREALAAGRYRLAPDWASQTTTTET
jgi:hypothetical protein